MNPRDLSAHVAYRGGRGPEAVARSLGMDPAELVVLSSNENPLGPSPAVQDAIREAAAEGGRYPKAIHEDLVEALARHWDVDPAQIWLANGGDGAIDYLFRATLEPGDAILEPTPGFAYYGMSARFHHGRVDRYDLSRERDFRNVEEALLAVYDGHRVVVVTSPHNPTGAQVSPDTVRRIAAETDPETLVLVDEAYAEYATGPDAVRVVTGADGEPARSDVAVVRTFSKAYGLAGLRLGYAIAPIDWADAYPKVRTPFAAGTLSCRAGLAALEDDAHLERSISLARAGRARLRRELSARVWPSEGNFVLAEVGDGSAVANAAQERGVLIRDCTSFGLPDCVRITVGTPAELDRAVEAIETVLGEAPSNGARPANGGSG